MGECASVCFSYDLRVPGPHVCELAAHEKDWEDDEVIIINVLWAQTFCRSEKSLRLCCSHCSRGASFSRCLLGIMCGEQLKSKTPVYAKIVRLIHKPTLKCQTDLQKWKKGPVCKRSPCERRKLRPLISCVRVCRQTGRPNRSAAIRNQPNSPRSHPCPGDTLSHPHTSLSARAPGPLWVNLAQPWPENRVVSLLI